MNSQNPKTNSERKNIKETSSLLFIEFNVISCFNYASWQNSVPFLKSLSIRNESSDSFDNLQLTLKTEPGFSRAKKWNFDCIRPETTIDVKDIHVQLDPAYLNGLNEAERGRVTFQLLQGETLLCEQTIDIRILAHDEWGGFGAMGDLLAAFVMPNDPAIATILKAASRSLSQHGHSSALDGYQSNDPARAYMLGAAAWSAIAAEGLSYTNPPRSFETVGQKTRRPSTILSDGLATCLDTSLLFASVIEAIGLNPILLLVDGHCFAGFWLVEKTFKNLIETDVSEVRKALAANELVTFETTLVTQQPPARFKDAVTSAKQHTSEIVEDQFIAAIDVTRARMSRIRPLASHDDSQSNRKVSADNNVAIPLPQMPSFGTVASDDVDVKPTTPIGRIDRWQRKLLDLSLRNRLLNFRATKQTVPFFCPDVPLLEDLLADRKVIRIISLTENNPIGDRDAKLHHQKTGEDIHTEFALAALDRNEIAAQLTSTELTTRLVKLNRTAKNDMAEGGTNTLFLAAGFLKWKREADDEKTYRAPLLLIPVKLTRKSVISPFQLRHHEDDVRFNATLIQMLKKDFGCDISQLESELPRDESGIDVPLILSQVQKSVRDIPGFEVVDDTALSTFSFAKYLMWKDLVDRTAHLAKNRVVRHMIQDPDKPYESKATSPIPASRDIDRNYESQQLIHPLAADSSQLTAIMAASEGHDFVLIGPPGTGKSQTIANMIAQCLANRKTVLFVAEKTAALDVVYRRLCQHGLGDICLELHSNKAERRKFLSQLKGSWKAKTENHSGEWISVNKHLQVRRDELNLYVSEIHKQHANGWTVFQAMGLSVKHKADYAPKLGWKDSVRIDSERYKFLEELVEDLGLTFQQIKPNRALQLINVTEWSAAWEGELLQAADGVTEATEKLRSPLKEILSAIGMKLMSDCSSEVLSQLCKLAQMLLDVAAIDFKIVFDKDFSKVIKQVDSLEQHLNSYQHAKKSLSAQYEHESLLRIPLEDLDQQWRNANASMWLFSCFSKRKVKKLLQSYASNGVANPEVDLPQIRVMKKQMASVTGNPLAERTFHWKGVETNIDDLKTYLEHGKQVRRTILDFGKLTDSLKTVSSRLAPIVMNDSSEHPILKKAESFLMAEADFQKACDEFENVAEGKLSEEANPNVLESTLKTIEEVKASRLELRSWTAWTSIKQKAIANGLSRLVDDLEKERIPPNKLQTTFKLAFVKWWLPRAIDQSDTLRRFQRFKHEDAIVDFRKLDNLAREEATDFVRMQIAHDLPQPDKVPRKSELGLLRHQMGLKRPSKAIREVISGMSESFSQLAPCLLMSPLSIAQYLPAEHSLFDVVIFDEASQITTWDAIGAIARGRQTIIVGDPKQLPPTNFFGRIEDDEDNEELEDYDKDLESILDEATASGLPLIQLNWHYRSRHESLISFSNWNYYDNKLITFPSAVTEDQAVSLKHLPEAIYDRGKSRTNRIEAETLVADAIERMKSWINTPEEDRLTLGVVTFNTQQQTLIQDLFDEALRQSPELEWFFDDARIEPTIVKNLENVQGDERDVMLFSITNGPDMAGRKSNRVLLNFGALNRQGGERRLNVAVTRARQELVVYVSFLPDQLKAERTMSQGVRDLKFFLEYAQRGASVLGAGPAESKGSFESPFEEAVATALSAKGWQVVPQIGVSGFRVDLGIVHPERPGAFLAGIECDGATYHRSATARDRDKIREQVLRNLGWEIIRIWSPDWWYDSAGAIERVDEQLNQFLNSSREQLPK
ncbi:DNA helicase related protein [hydrothermal vent metagenome]|uniref:DNA helicase related protein n=1 Tax=hydrothermal vent metagenome TaxID=652676 RepID=A0A3B1E889_9ZZZZ